MLRRGLKKGYTKLFVLGGLFALLLGADALIKYWVHTFVTEPIVVWKGSFGIDFILQYVTNKGVAWGLFPSMHKVILLVRLLVIAGVLAYLLFKSNPFKKQVFLVCLLSGAVGNVLDSFLYGYVVDMFHFVFWGRSYGIFNFADAMIFFGSCGLFILYEKRRVPSL